MSGVSRTCRTRTVKPERSEERQLTPSASPSSRSQGSKRVPGKNVRPLGGHPMLAYTIAAGARERRVRVGDRVDRLGGDRRRSRATTAPRCRSCGRRRSPATRRPTSSGSSTRSRSCARRGRALGLLQPAAADEPVPHGGHDPPRVGAVHGAAGRRFAARGREVHAASGQDVGRARRADVSAAAVRLPRRAPA